MSYARGDVILVDFPNSDLIMAKRRPALIIQDTAVYTGLPQLILALITSNTARTGPSRVSVQKDSASGKAMGLLMDSVIVTDNIATIGTIAIRKKIGTCSVMTAVEAALRVTLKL